MLNEDKAQTYNRVLLEIYEIISRLKKIGINVQEYVNCVSNIDNDLKSELIESSNKFHSTFGSPEIYQKYIKKLLTVKYEISKYDEYVLIDSKILYLESIFEKINKKDIADYISELKKVHNSLYYSSTIDYRDEAELINRLYNLIYMTIKSELIIRGDSSLFYYISTYDNSKNYLSNLIKYDVQNYLNYSDINLEVNRIESENVVPEYFDINLIKKIAKITNSEINNNEHRQLLGLIKNYCEKRNSQKIITKEIEEKEENIKKIELRKRNCINKVVKRVLPSFMILISFLTFSIKKLPKMFPVTKYSTTISSYDESGLLKQKTDMLPERDENESIKLYVYDSEELKYKDNVPEYSVDTYDLGEYKGEDYQELFERVKDDFPNEDCLVIEITVQDMSNSIMGYNLDYVVVCMGVIISFYICFEFIELARDSKFSIINALWFIFDSKEFKDLVKDYKNNQIELNKMREKIQELVNEYNTLSDEKIELKKIFLHIYSENESQIFDDNRIQKFHELCVGDGTDNQSVLIDTNEIKNNYRKRILIRERGGQ